MYSTGENCVFILKLFNKGTPDEYDDMFTSGCNSIVFVWIKSKAESKAECGAYFTLEIFRTYIFEMFRTYIFVPSPDIHFCRLIKRISCRHQERIYLFLRRIFFPRRIYFSLHRIYLVFNVNIFYDKYFFNVNIFYDVYISVII